MGLSVYGYSQIAIIRENAYDEDGNRYDDVDDVFWKNPHFPAAYGNLVENAGYIGTYCDGPDFSYSGYGVWRNDLAKLAGYKEREFESYPGAGPRMLFAADCWLGATGPFAELINFSDCEGTIGTSFCKKILADFIEYEERAQAIGGWFYKQYALFRTVFEHASDDGCVKFS